MDDYHILITPHDNEDPGVEEGMEALRPIADYSDEDHFEKLDDDDEEADGTGAVRRRGAFEETPPAQPVRADKGQWGAPLCAEAARVPLVAAHARAAVLAGCLPDAVLVP